MTFSRRWFWLVALIPMGCGLARLRFNVEVLDLLPADVPAVQGLKIYQENFANARELIITVQAPTAEAADAAARRIAQTLSQRTDLIASVTWQPPWLEHPAQAAEFIASANSRTAWPHPICRTRLTRRANSSPPRCPQPKSRN